MKTLNLMPFSVAILIATIFATLPPYPVMAAGVTTSTVSVVDKSNVLSTPEAKAQVEQAIKAVKKYAQANYINGDSVSIEVSTTAPTGLDLSKTTVGDPVLVPPNMAVVCAAPLIMTVVYIVIVIIILGVAIYITYKIYKAVSCWASNINWHSTNDPTTESLISPKVKYAANSIPQGSSGLNTVDGLAPTRPFTFNLLSTTNLSNIDTNPSVSIVINSDGSISPSSTYSSDWTVGITTSNSTVTTLPYIPSVSISNQMKFYNGADAPLTTHTICLTNTRPKTAEFFLQMNPYAN